MSLSKSQFYECVSDGKCDLFHPWNESCIGANLDIFFSAIIGVNRFYNLYYFVSMSLFSYITRFL